MEKEMKYSQEGNKTFIPYAIPEKNGTTIHFNHGVPTNTQAQNSAMATRDSVSSDSENESVCSLMGPVQPQRRRQRRRRTKERQNHMASLISGAVALELARMQRSDKEGRVFASSGHEKDTASGELGVDDGSDRSCCILSRSNCLRRGALPPLSAWFAYKALNTTEFLHIKHLKYGNSA